MIKEAYVSKGNIKVSEHFKLKELQCKDGTDLVKYCPETLEMIEKLRALTECKRVNVTSGYRTPAHNRAIGGASSSSHTEGYAIDCNFEGSKYSHKQICCMAQDLGMRGIGYISSTAVHLDMKNRTYRGDERYGYSNNVGGDFYKYFNIEKGSLPTSKVEVKQFPTIKRSNAYKYVYYVRQIQTILRNKGYVNVDKNGKLTKTLISVDGKWGNNTDQAVKRFQKNNNLVVDRIVGGNTWNALYK